MYRLCVYSAFLPRLASVPSPGGAHTVTYCLAVTPCSLLHPPPPPPPYFREKLLIVPIIRPPLRAARAGLRYCSSCSLISDGFLRPVILHVILPCCLAAGGRSLADLLCFPKKWQHVRGQQLFHPSVLPWHVNSRLLLHNRASLISVREFMGGGGLNCEAKAQVLVVTPPPPPPPPYFSWK